jgi:hypothetical protein
MRPLSRLLALWLVAAALCARAVEVGVGGGYAYPRVAVGWANPLPGAFATLAQGPGAPHADLLTAFSQLDIKDAAARQSLAPITYALTNDLHLTPEKFLKLSAEDRALSLGLALDQARDELVGKVNALAARAAQAHAVQAGDREAQAELYHTLAELAEIRRFYSPLMNEETRTLVAESYATADRRATAIREELLKQAGEALKTPDTAKAAPVPLVELTKPTPNAVKLLADMRNNRVGWGLDDIRAVYKGYGFTEIQGGKHVKFTHPAFPQLTQHVSRGSSLSPAYARDAVELIDELEKLRAARAPPVPNQAPKEIPFSELSFLLDKPKVEVLSARALERKKEMKSAAREARETAKAATVVAEPQVVEAVVKTPEPQIQPAVVKVEEHPSPVMTLQPATRHIEEVKPEMPPPQAEPAKKTPFWKKIFNKDR